MKISQSDLVNAEKSFNDAKSDSIIKETRHKEAKNNLVEIESKLKDVEVSLKEMKFSKEELFKNNTVLFEDLFIANQVLIVTQNNYDELLAFKDATCNQLEKITNALGIAQIKHNELLKEENETATYVNRLNNSLSQLNKDYDETQTALNSIKRENFNYTVLIETKHARPKILGLINDNPYYTHHNETRFDQEGYDKALTYLPKLNEKLNTLTGYKNKIIQNLNEASNYIIKVREAKSSWNQGINDLNAKKIAEENDMKEAEAKIITVQAELDLKKQNLEELKKQSESVIPKISLYEFFGKKLNQKKDEMQKELDIKVQIEQQTFHEMETAQKVFKEAQNHFEALTEEYLSEVQSVKDNVSSTTLNEGPQETKNVNTTNFEANKFTTEEDLLQSKLSDLYPDNIGCDNNYTADY